MELDSAVAQLCKSNPEMGEALVRYYLNGLDYRALARKMDIDQERAYGLVKAGESWVSGVLDVD